MRIDRPGRVTEGIYYLGREESCVYLMESRGEYVLVGGGMAYIIPQVLAQLRELDLDEKKISRIIILHGHFDHMGIVPFFTRRWPWVRVTASSRVGELFGNPRVAETVTGWNRELAARHGRPDILEELEINYAGMEVQYMVGEGDEILVGNLRLKVLATPGHSTCSISIYLPGEGVLFGSDAAGVPYRDQAITVASSNFRDYEKSLRRLAALEPRVYLAEHYGGMTGDDAGGYLKQSIEAMEKTRETLEKFYHLTGDMEKTARELTRMRTEVSPGYFVPEGLQFQVTLQMVKNYLKSRGDS